jgi:hypothetical protein|tara:strand:+ start:151 stop:963 length:813 start_codon:yes stop_codon:yes gene_type:complete
LKVLGIFYLVSATFTPKYDMLWKFTGTMIVSAVLLLGCTPVQRTVSYRPPPPNASPRELIESINAPEYFEYLDEGETDLYPAVVMIATEDGEMIASGVLIKPDVVLTAAHCLDEDNAFAVENGSESVMIKDIIMHECYDPWLASNDIGIIFLECPMSAKPIELWGGGDYPRMSNITTIGYGAGHKKWSKDETFFYYGTIVEEPWFIKFLPMYGPIWHGDSGGAVVYDGKLIGIISSYTMHRSHGDINVIECSATSIRMYKHWIDGILKSR